MEHKNQKLAQSTIDQIVKLHLEGKSQTMIAGIVGVAQTTVGRYVNAHKKTEAAIREKKLATLKKAREALAKKVAARKAVGPVPMPTTAQTAADAFQKGLKKAKAARKNLKKANAARAAKRALGPVPMPADEGIRVNPSPDTTLREVAAAAATLGLELHVQFVRKA